MIRSILFLLLFLIFGCQSKPKNEIGLTVVKSDVEDLIKKNIDEEIAIDYSTLNINFKLKENYTSIISKIKTDKTYFRNLYEIDKNKAIDSASNYLYSKLINDIVPHWYGTPWDLISTVIKWHKRLD